MLSPPVTTGTAGTSARDGTPTPDRTRPAPRRTPTTRFRTTVPTPVQRSSPAPRTAATKPPLPPVPSRAIRVGGATPNNGSPGSRPPAWWWSGLFWAANSFACAFGQGRAVDYAQRLPTEAEVALDT